jgi:Virulence-associated protein E
MADDDDTERPDDDGTPPRGRGPKPVSGRWPGGEYKNDGGPKPNMRNAQTALQRLGCVCSFNRFKHRFVVNGPREKKLSTSRTVNLDIGEIRDDHDFSELRDYIIAAHGYDPLFNHVKEAVEILGLRRKFHPILDYFAGLPPRDEVKRLDTWMITTFGAEDNDYTRAVSRLSLIAAVCRVRFPGCKFDTAPVLIGSQGVAKSTALRVLAVRDEWFTDQPILAQNSQRQMEHMEGGWLCEIADLDGMRRAETTYVKAFMSRQFDKSRMAYRHLTEERGRQCVFFATTNEAKFLRDETGNRRWWPVQTNGMANIAWLRENRDQLWAEANEAALALITEHGTLPYEALALPSELWPVAEALQLERVVDEPWAEEIALLEHKGNMTRKRYFSPEVADWLGLRPEQRHQVSWTRIANAMKANGYTQTIICKWVNGVEARGRGYKPKEDIQAAENPGPEPKPGEPGGRPRPAGGGTQSTNSAASPPPDGDTPF